MTPKQFRRRATYLALPTNSYGHARYDLQQAPWGRATARPPPSQAHNSGMRADRCGYLVLIKHAAIKHIGARYVVRLVVDTATTLRSFYVQPTLDTIETLGNILKWVHGMKCKPTAIVAEMQFSTDKCCTF